MFGPLLTLFLCRVLRKESGLFETLVLGGNLRRYGLWVNIILSAVGCFSIVPVCVLIASISRLGSGTGNVMTLSGIDTASLSIWPGVRFPVW